MINHRTLLWRAENEIERLQAELTRECTCAVEVGREPREAYVRVTERVLATKPRGKR